MHQDVINLLLESIESDRLVVLCGAGLSMAPPSSLPAAWQVAEICHQRHCALEPSFDVSIRHDLEAVAEHFAQRGKLTTYFVRKLVPWERFRTQSNSGHAALADFLLCRAVFAVMSSNYDDLIEGSARRDNADLQVALDGDQANVHAASHAPLLKFHGCADRDRDRTVWAPSQLASDTVIVERTKKTRTWMKANLREKDLLIIGFWSDWSYLNQLVGAALTDVTPPSVTVVDPLGADRLAEKAPDLWKRARADGINFRHVEQSGSDFLEDLRKQFSCMYMRKIFAKGMRPLEDEFGVTCDPAWLEQPEMSGRAHYGWRRDAEGGAQAPRKKAPDTSSEGLGHFHLLLRRAGATANEYGYEIGGMSVRVVNGAGRFLNVMRSSLLAPPMTTRETDLVVCVGSTGTSLPANFVRPNTPGSFLRPAGMGRFVTEHEARQILQV